MGQEDELHRVTRMLEALTSEHDDDRQQIEKLTNTVADQNAYIKLMDEEQTKRLDQLSTSQQPEQPSTVSLDETKTRLSEIESTLAAVAQQLSESALVKLRDGSSMKRLDLEALSVLKTVLTELKTTTSASADLAESVRKRGQVTIDTDKLTEHAAKVFDTRLARAVDAPVRGVEQVIEGFEHREARQRDLPGREAGAHGGLRRASYRPALDRDDLDHGGPSVPGAAALRNGLHHPRWSRRWYQADARYWSTLFVGVGLIRCRDGLVGESADHRQYPHRMRAVRLVRVVGREEVPRELSRVVSHTRKRMPRAIAARGIQRRG